MKTTYNEILNHMKTAYFEHCGEPVEAFSDTAARLEAAASELFSLACSTEHMLRQSFAQTASGEYLDFHAALRGITRKRAAKAQGSLTFSVLTPKETDTVIPKGTLCSKDGAPFIQFITTKAVTLISGATEVTAPAEATEPGWEYNAQAHTVTVMVNPPAGIDSADNGERFSGGSSEEGDDALRRRILDSYRIPQSGFSLASLREALLERDEVLDCAVYYDEGVIRIPLRIRAGASFEMAAKGVESSVTMAALLGCQVEVIQAADCTFSLSAEVKTASSDSAAVAEEVRAVLENAVSAAKIGEDIPLNRLVYLASCVEGVQYCEVSSPTAVQGLLLCPQNAYLTMNSLEVTAYE